MEKARVAIKNELGCLKQSRSTCNKVYDFTFLLQITKNLLAEFDIIERPMFELHAQCPNVTVVNETVTQLEAQKHVSNFMKCSLLNSYCLNLFDTRLIKVIIQCV